MYPRHLVFYSLATTLLLATPSWAFAYIGPGLGGGAIAAILGILAALLMLVLGVLWYPLKKIWSKLRKKFKK